MSQLRTELASHNLGPARKCADGWHQTFYLPESFAGFEGHFPDNPVVPAVVQLLMGLLLAEAAAGKALAIVQVVKAKFLQPLRPLETIEVCCVQEQEDGLCCKVEISSASGMASQFRLILSASAEHRQGKGGE